MRVIGRVKTDTMLRRTLFVYFVCVMRRFQKGNLGTTEILGNKANAFLAIYPDSPDGDKLACSHLALSNLRTFF